MSWSSPCSARGPPDMNTIVAQHASTPASDEMESCKQHNCTKNVQSQQSQANRGLAPAVRTLSTAPSTVSGGNSKTRRSPVHKAYSGISKVFPLTPE